mgnify:FL=1
MQSLGELISFPFPWCRSKYISVGLESDIPAFWREMGMSFSCPLSHDLDGQLESLLVRQISFERGDVKAVIRSVSFNGRDSDSKAAMKSFDSGKMILEGSLSFKGRELEISLKAPAFDVENAGIIASINAKSKQVPPTSPAPDSVLRNL